MAAAEPVQDHRRQGQEQHLEQQQEPRVGPDPVQGGDQGHDVGGVLAQQVEPADGHERRPGPRQQPGPLVVDADVEAVGPEPGVGRPGRGGEHDHEDTQGDPQGESAQPRRRDPGGGDEPPPRLEQSPLDPWLTRRPGPPIREGSQARGGRSRAVHSPRPGGHGGDGEAAEAPGQLLAARRGQQLDLGGLVEGVGGQRLGQAERLGVALGVVGGVVQVEQVQVGQDVGRVLESGHVGVGGRPVQGQGEPAATPPVEGDGGRPLLVQGQVGGRQPPAAPPRRRPGLGGRAQHYRAVPGFMADEVCVMPDSRPAKGDQSSRPGIAQISSYGDHDPRRQHWRRSPSSPARG
jgi:hypothetical protein